MLKILVTYKCGTQRLVEVLHEWDVDSSDVVTVHDIVKDLKGNYVGKYLRFDDHSGWYVKVLYNKGIYINTEAGMFILTDLVLGSNVKYPGTQYSGLFRSDESELIRPISNNERHIVKKVLKGDRSISFTQRLKRLVLKELQEIVNSHGVTTEWVVSRLKELASSKRGTIGDKHKVLVDLLKIINPEVAGLLSGHQGGNNKQPLLAQFNQYNIHNERRSRSRKLPKKKELMELVGSVSSIEDDIDE